MPPLLMNAMKLAEPASTGAAEMSVFHQLSEGNSGKGPGISAFAAGKVAGHWAKAAGDAQMMLRNSRILARRLIGARRFKCAVDDPASDGPGRDLSKALLPRWRPSPLAPLRTVGRCLRIYANVIIILRHDRRKAWDGWPHWDRLAEVPLPQILCSRVIAGDALVRPRYSFKL